MAKAAGRKRHPEQAELDRVMAVLHELSHSLPTKSVYTDHRDGQHADKSSLLWLQLQHLEKCLRKRDLTGVALSAIWAGALGVMVDKRAIEAPLEEKKAMLTAMCGAQSRAVGKENRQTVRDTRKRILKAEPNIEPKALMGRLKKETGLGERAIYNHLSED